MYSRLLRVITGLGVATIAASSDAAVQDPLLLKLASESIIKQDVLTPEVGAFIEKILADWNSPGGVGVAVVQKNTDGSWNVETKGYGVAKADGSNVDENTLFSIGSNSKVGTNCSKICLISALIPAVRYYRHGSRDLKRESLPWNYLGYEDLFDYP